QPLHIRCWDTDETASRRPIALDRMQPVVRRVQHLIDDVVAARNQRDGNKRQDQLWQQVPGPQAGVDAERNDNPRQNKQMLDRMIEPGDGKMGAEPLREGDLSALDSWHEGYVSPRRVSSLSISKGLTLK